MQQTPHKRKNLGSYPYLTVVFTISLSLIVIGLFITLIVHAKALTSYIQKNIELHIYLNNYISDAELVKLESIIGSQPYVLKENGRVALEFISKEDAVKEFINETGENFTDVLDVNPLRASLVIKINPAFGNVTQLENIRKKLEETSGVYEVDFNSRKEKEVNAINENIKKILFFLAIFVFIALLTIVVLIRNTIKIALFSQRFLIRSMQLVGAKAGFIRWPFVQTALFQGLASGVISALIIMNLLQYIYNDFQLLKEIVDIKEMLLVLSALPFIGGFITSFSTHVIVSKYLKMSLDELY